MHRILVHCTMENGEDVQNPPKEKIIKIFKDFMTRIAKFEELVTMGSRLLVCFRQALGFMGRPPIDKTSALVDRLIKAHGTRRFLSYFEAGCVNSHDSVQNLTQLNTCHLGFQDHMTKAKSVLDELKCLLDDVLPLVQSTQNEEGDVNDNLDLCIDSDGEEQVSSSNPSKPVVVEFAVLMAVIYSMVKQDYTMQDLIVSSLDLKSSPEELETYCLMWLLRPYIDDDIMHKAWSLIP